MRDPSLWFVARDGHPDRMPVFWRRIDKAATPPARFCKPGIRPEVPPQIPKRVYIYLTARVKP